MIDFLSQFVRDLLITVSATLIVSLLVFVFRITILVHVLEFIF